MRVLGPATVQRDRVDYISAIAESWKEQTLLNVVRLRYGDASSFADVSSVLAKMRHDGCGARADKAELLT